MSSASDNVYNEKKRIEKRKSRQEKVIDIKIKTFTLFSNDKKLELIYRKLLEISNDINS